MSKSKTSIIIATGQEIYDSTFQKKIARSRLYQSSSSSANINFLHASNAREIYDLQSAILKKLSESDLLKLTISSHGKSGRIFLAKDQDIHPCELLRGAFHSLKTLRKESHLLFELFGCEVGKDIRQASKEEKLEDSAYDSLPENVTCIIHAGHFDTRILSHQIRCVEPTKRLIL